MSHPGRSLAYRLWGLSLLLLVLGVLTGRPRRGPQQGARPAYIGRREPGPKCALDERGLEGRAERLVGEVPGVFGKPRSQCIEGLRLDDAAHGSGLCLVCDGIGTVRGAGRLDGSGRLGGPGTLRHSVLFGSDGLLRSCSCDRFRRLVSRRRSSVGQRDRGESVEALLQRGIQGGSLGQCLACLRNGRALERIELRLDRFAQYGERLGRSAVTDTKREVIERESQKGMVIGKGGLILKEVGKLARAQLPEGCFLELFVKVVPNWRRNPSRLAELGYRGD